MSAVALMFSLTHLGFASEGMPKVIYGKDDRLDLYQVTNPLFQRLARSTVALINARQLRPGQQDEFTLMGETLVQSQHVCTTERFANQQTAAFCSGVIVGPDLVLTAGHCLDASSTCQNTRFIVGYALSQLEQTEVSQIPARNVYTCKSVVAQEYSHFEGDYSLVQVDRPFQDVEIATLNRTGNISVGTPLVLMGHPSGLPLKIAAGATVRDNRRLSVFVTNTDSYAGNSGSPVFNSETGNLEGVLVSGERDFLPQPRNGGCFESFHCSLTGCSGESVTRISLITGLIRP